MALLLLGIGIFIAKLLNFLHLMSLISTFHTLSLYHSLSETLLLLPFIKPKQHTTTTKAKPFSSLYNKTGKPQKKPFPLFYQSLQTLLGSNGTISNKHVQSRPRPSKANRINGIRSFYPIEPTPLQDSIPQQDGFGLIASDSNFSDAFGVVVFP